MKMYTVTMPVVATGNISVEVDADSKLEAAQNAVKRHWGNPEEYDDLGWDSDLMKLAKMPTTAEELVANGLVEEDE